MIVARKDTLLYLAPKFCAQVLRLVIHLKNVFGALSLLRRSKGYPQFGKGSLDFFSGRYGWIGYHRAT